MSCLVDTLYIGVMFLSRKLVATARVDNSAWRRIIHKPGTGGLQQSDGAKFHVWDRLLQQTGIA